MSLNVSQIPLPLTFLVALISRGSLRLYVKPEKLRWVGRRTPISLLLGYPECQKDRIQSFKEECPASRTVSEQSQICEAAIVQVQPAESTKEELKKYFDEVIVSANDLKDALLFLMFT